MPRFFPLLVALLLPLVPAQGQEAPSLQEVQTTYEALDGLRATFAQTVRSEFAGQPTRLQGSVLLAGNKYRVQTPQQTVVTDGRTTWIYTPADSQVVVNAAEREQAPITPTAFLSGAAERYTVDRTGTAVLDGTPHHTLALAAAADTTRFRTARLWVRQGDRIVTRVRATDRNGTTLDLRLSEIELNPPLPESPFTFTPPEGVDVVDLRSRE